MLFNTMQCAKPMSIRGIATCICHVVTILARDARNCMLAGLRRQLLMLFFTVMSSVWVDKPFKYKRLNFKRISECPAAAKTQ